MLGGLRELSYLTFDLLKTEPFFGYGLGGRSLGFADRLSYKPSFSCPGAAAFGNHKRDISHLVQHSDMLQHPKHGEGVVRLSDLTKVHPEFVDHPPELSLPPLS